MGGVDSGERQGREGGGHCLGGRLEGNLSVKGGRGVLPRRQTGGESTLVRAAVLGLAPVFFTMNIIRLPITP